jgi:hypothetical protein
LILKDPEASVCVPRLEEEAVTEAPESPLPERESRTLPEIVRS